MLTRARKVDDATFVELAEEIRRSIGCRPVELRVSAEIASAATVGWRRPALVVAADWQQWSDQELRTVIAHEVMHVRSNDYLTGLIARVTMVLYFYHPLVRWLGTRFFLAQEAAADAAAARLVGGRANYLAALSRIALRQDRQITSLPVLAFVSSFSTFLMRRIEMLETKDGRHSPAKRVLQGVALAGLCFGAIVVSALRTPAQDGESASEIGVPAASKEAEKSIDGDTDSSAQGTSRKGEALPPLPTNAKYKTWCVFQDGSAFAIRNMVLGRHLTRTEGPGQTVKISNHGKRLSLYPEDKEATITEAPEDYQCLGYFEAIRRKLTDAEYASSWKQRQMLGESEIGGRTAVGYRFINGWSIHTIWVDPDSLLPIQIEFVDQMYPDMMSIETDFVYNVALDESLFSLDPPADCTVTVRPCPKEPAPCQEIDLIETFRQYREHNQGTFPDTLDTSSTRDLVARKRRALGDTPTAQQLDDLSEFNSRVNDGLRFVVHLPTEADAHYAGKGVKADTTDTPIFWYRPEGKAEYRVIRADLSAVEVDSPPEIPGALSLNDWDRKEQASRRPWRNPAAAHNVQNLTALARRIGIVPNTRRASIEVRVLPGSAAEKAGLRAGDRITALSGEKVERLEDVAAHWALLPFYAEARQSLEEEGVRVTLLREGKEVEVTLPGSVLKPFVRPSNAPEEANSEPPKVIARVGSLQILESDVLPLVEERCRPHVGRMPEKQIRAQRDVLMRRFLETVIDTKVIYLAFLRSLPSDKRDKVVSKIWRRVDEAFNDRELDKHLKKAGVGSPAELDAALRQYGSSLKKQRCTYGERAIAQSFLRQKIDFDPNITHEEMLAYYREHLDEYERQGDNGAEGPWDQRRSAKLVSFQEAEVEIRERLRKQRVKSEIEEFIANVREKAPVWTIYDEESAVPDIPQR